MRFSLLNFLATAIPIGAGVALLTGLVNSTPKGLVGAVWYGFPRAWLIRLVIAPQYYPWRLDVLGLVIDLVFWCFVAVVIELTVAWLHDYSKHSTVKVAT